MSLNDVLQGREARLPIAEIELIKLMAETYDDPLAFVMAAFPWGEKGTPLENETGPDDNQREFLLSLAEEIRRRDFDGSTPVMPVQMAETSGHGTGKSALGAWIVCFLLSTRPNSRGTVTAGTFTQLKTRTWAAAKYWMKLCITAHWFDIQDNGIRAKEAPDSWYVVPQTCKKENAQAFAGQHAKDSTSWYLFDESSEVDDEIWKTAYGGLTDGEPMIFAWGQMVRNTGEFYRICFGSLKERWNHRRVDSRTSRFTNKALIEQWIGDYGEDSDFVRVRVLGLPPNANELQFIDRARCVDASRRQGVYGLPNDPLICGMDVSGGGAAWSVFRFRRGLDGRSIPAVRIPGDRSKDRELLIARAASILADKRPGYQVSAMFVDSAFGSPIVERLHLLGFQNVFEINFGGNSPDVHQENMRAYMWNQCKEWLGRGSIPDEEELIGQLSCPGFHFNKRNKLVLESKESISSRGEASPDDADALALTFAQPVAALAPVQPAEPSGAYSGAGGGVGGWMR